MIPTFFRSVPVSGALSRGEPQSGRDTIRLPTNVPYIVDNLWEHLRPEWAPHRRQSVYASPVASDAQTSRMVADKGLGVAVYRVVISGPAKIAQLQVADAKEHRDIPAVRKLLQDMSPDMLGAPWQVRQEMAPLFLPSASKEDLRRTVKASSLARAFMEQATGLSRFWTDVEPESFNATGEIFFELAPGSTYRLLPIDPA